ncbi:hypothetical protein H0H93_014407 [Arthromyces matolae]|nr:hypothetical protein H0H93_014407 [Arthromyces matolae]
MVPGSGFQPKSDHLATLKLLISRGMPLDVPDIVGYTALHHAIISPSIHVPLFKELLSSGANVNVQNRYGEVPIFCAFMKHHIPAIELLLEYDADLTIAEADGLRPDTAAITFGPQVTAVVQKWIRKRKGEEPAPRDEKRCGCCGDTEKSLKNCGRCQVERYCSVECQRKAWPTHKRTCQPFSSSNTVTLKPFYGGYGPGGLVENLMPMSELRNKFFGINQPTPDAHHRHAAVPKNLDSDSKNIIIKAQLPYGGGFGKFDFSPTANAGDILVYTKKRDLVCRIRRNDGSEGYDRLAKMIAEKGVGGAKAYFAAELRSKEELVVKVGEVLAEQPF